LYERAFAISEELSAREPTKTTYRHDLALAQLGAGNALLQLGRAREALLRLTSALETAQSLSRSEPDERAHIVALARIHRSLGDAAVARGDANRALEHYRQALVSAEKLARLSRSNLDLQRQHADALESLGRYYSMLARRQREHAPEARRWLEKSLAVWQDWRRRKLATPYAGVREREALALIASLQAR
jgi:tetratricopeptide (TPR) repeat protein